ncbi:Thioredoxin [Penicillium lagena]|uniref:Thioredoxin n=1 Tax=Penicillium lagena TaxID=94218 RepID=UPI002541165F|nr:Thioredoxin [Penicillium lagena]KAJ5619997.1 Thioredoxin [Penicillium lagena]
MGGNIVDINSMQEWKEKVIESGDLVVVDFHAEWCGPCKAIAPAIENLSTQHTNVKFYKVNVDDVADVAAENGISAMPTFLFMKGADKIDTVRGANPPAIQAGLQKLLTA